MNSNIEKIKKEIQSANQEIEKLKDELRNKTKEMFHEGIKILFNEYPIIKQVHFTAYTPYFNDGDECEYACHHEYSGFNGYSDAGELCSIVSELFGIKPSHDVLHSGSEKVWVEAPNPDYNPNGDETYYNRKTKHDHIVNKNFNKDHKTAVKEFRSYLALFTDEQYKNMFGDHAFVMIDSNGVYVEGYNHD